MALVKSSRPSSSSSSSNFSTLTVIVFISLCLLGVWMMTSTTMVPVDMSSTENKSEIKQQASDTAGKYEDSSGDVPDEVGRSDSNNNANDSASESKLESSEDQKDENSTQTDENMAGKAQDGDKKDDNSTQTDENMAGKAQDGDKKDDNSTQTAYSDENGNTEGGEAKEDGQENGLEMKVEETSQETSQEASQETTDGEQENKASTYSDENGNTEAAEMAKEGDESKVGAEENGQEKSTEETSQETTQQGSDGASDANDNTGAGEEQKFDETAGEGQNKSSDQQNSDDNNAKVDKAEEKSNEITVVVANKTDGQVSDEVFPDGAQSELLNETSTQNGAWSTQAAESKNEKEARTESKERKTTNSWKLCNFTVGADYIPCLDNEKAIKKLVTTKHYEHRERHCPDEPPTCLVPLPEGYKLPIEWPNSRNKIWYYNVPHTQLATIKAHQNWVKVSGEYLTFPGGGTQFKHGALHYIDFIQESVPDIAWGKNSRVVLDVGCGVASFGGFQFDRDVLTMSIAPKDEHEAQVQFALERGIPAISAVMGTIRLPFPGMVFDVIHCARCRVPWHIEGGKLLLELNRLLRPGGYFVWSATPVYQKDAENTEIWKAMTELTKSMCWEMLNKTKDRLNQVGMAIYRKPSNNECYTKRTDGTPPLCKGSDDPNAAWNISLQACMHEVPVDTLRGSKWPREWPQRLKEVPYWLNSSQVGVYGKPAPKDFKADFDHWKNVVSNSYLEGMGIKWSSVRNVMDMRAVYGGFAAALQEAKEMTAWVMNIVPINAPDTLPVIYERGLFGIYHDWCESFSTYPRSYDLLHADHLFSKLKERCKLLPVMVEVDRILRPGGKLIVRDNGKTIQEMESMAKSLNYKVRMTFSKESEGLLCVEKTMWRPEEVEASLP
ncbi:hypothetical protein Cni_G20604 [Canna indica]|uniref:Methyltransferase PMT26 n=1 Tax=Canna indica TaxID=4628 RepID=A0AAQ3KPD5_9LILI|nr:hypothetical protein Cni_G20604 [Canna indica]